MLKIALSFAKADHKNKTFNNKLLEELCTLLQWLDSIDSRNEREEIAKVLTRIAMLGKPLTEEELIESLNKDQPMSDNKNITI